MILSRPLLASRRQRRGVAGIIVAVMIFVLIFTAALSYFYLTLASNQTAAQVSITSEANLLQARQEQLAIQTPSSTAVDAATAGDVWLRIVNVGGVPTTITSVYVTSLTAQILTTSQSAPHSYFLRGSPDLNVTLPISLSVGSSTQFTDCGAGNGCDIAIAKGAYSYTPGSAVMISVLTTTGNVFSAEFPPNPLSATTTVTTISSAFSTTTTSTGGISGNALVVQMTATPTSVLSSAIVTDTVTVYNYGPSALTGVTLDPSIPASAVTGTASLSGGSCTPASYPTIPAFSGSGNAPNVVFTCTWTASTGAVGGFASFSGYAQATQNTILISSAQAISNSVQIGGTVSVQTDGVFSLNFFFFRYSACTVSPAGSTGSYTYSSSTTCAVNPATMPPASPSNLPDGATISGSGNHYVAFYIEVTNNFNTTVPLLDYSQMQFDASAGGETDFFIVGTATSPQVPYYPNYCGAGGCGSNLLPTFTPYTANEVTCAESAPNYSPPSATSCIDVAPGQTIILTFAACGIGASNWDWGGSSRGQSFDSRTGCDTSNAAFSSNGSANGVEATLCYLYKGQVLTQVIAFQGDAVLP